VGVTSIVAPLLGGFLADISGHTETAFIFAAVVALAAFIAQWIMLNPAGIVAVKK
jgi:MFS-type transporter involved in bile tolerance (Atg22 family)